MADVLVRAVTECGQFRAAAAITTEAVREMKRRHQTLAPATAAIGRALCGAYLLASQLKGDERLTIQIVGDGPLGEIYVEADPVGNGRGYARNPEVDLPPENGKTPVGKAVGSSGTLTVVKDLGLKDPYSGSVPLVSGELGKDLAYYLSASEQIPSAVALGVYQGKTLAVEAAGGYLVQAMPDATEEAITRVVSNIENLPTPTEIIRNGASAQGMIEMALNGLKIKFLGEQGLRFRCRCSKERFAGALVALGEKELEEMIREDHGAELTCEFCREQYSFTEDEIKELLGGIHDKTPADQEN